jgi:hypothetical protein
MSDTRRMREVISTLNNMREVKAMREQALETVIKRIEYRVKAQAMYKIKNMAYKKTVNKVAQEKYEEKMKRQTFKGLREY